MGHQLHAVFTKSRMLTEARSDCEWQASTQLGYHGYFSPRVAAESSNNSEKSFICEIPYLPKWLHSNIIIQKLNILAEFMITNDGQ